MDQEPLLTFLITGYVQVEMVGLGDYLMVIEGMCLITKETSGKGWKDNTNLSLLLNGHLSYQIEYLYL